MPISKFKNVKMPEELFDVCSKIVKEREELGYCDHMELIVDAVKRRIEELQKRRTKIITNKKLKNLR